MLEIINKNKIYNKVIFIIEFIVSVIFGISIYKIGYKLEDLNYIPMAYYIIANVCVLALVILIYFNCTKYKDKIEKLFLTFIIPLGIIFLIVLPINWVPDEERHIFKTYDISMGNFITNFGEKNEGEIYVSRQLVEAISEPAKINYSSIHKKLNIKADYNELIAVDTICKTYNPINYLTGAVTFFVARLCNINILLACYIGRLINFLIFVIVGYFCIKIIPFGKLLLAIYMFLPMIIQQQASLSADTFINNISLLFIVYNIKLLYQKNDLSLKQRLIYYVLSISIALCKYVYFPLTLMSIMLINNKSIDKKNRNKLISISVILSALSVIIWFAFSQKYVDIRPYIVENNVRPIKQIKYIIQNPLKYVITFGKAIVSNGEWYILSFIGSQLGFLNINIPTIFPLTMLYGVAMLPFFEKNQKSLNKNQKITMNLIAIILIVLIFTGLYLTWTPLHSNGIAGVQGRYFIPVFILILLSMIRKNENIKIKNIELKYFLTYSLLNVLTITFMYKEIL